MKDPNRWHRSEAFQSNGNVRTEFAQWLRDQGPEPFAVTPLIRRRLIELGWTPPDPETDERVEWVSPSELLSRTKEAFGESLH